MDLWLDRLALVLPGLAAARAVPAAVRAQQALDAGRTVEALVRFEVARALCDRVFPPTSDQHLLALSGHAAALAELGRYDEAEEPLRRQLRIVDGPVTDELRLAAWTNFAAWCEATARVREEEGAWARIGSLPGADRDAAALSRAICLRWLDRLDEAAALVEPLPASPWRELLLARIAAERGAWEEAERRSLAAAEALEDDVSRAIARSRRAVALAALGRADEARAEMDRAEALAGPDGDGRRQVCADRARLDPPNAVRWLEAALAATDRRDVLQLELRVRLAVARRDPPEVRAALRRDLERGQVYSLLPFDESQ